MNKIPSSLSTWICRGWVFIMPFVTGFIGYFLVTRQPDKAAACAFVWVVVFSIVNIIFWPSSRDNGMRDLWK